MTETPRRFSDQIRQAIDSSGLSRYRIAKEVNIAQATLSRFMTGKGGLSMASLDRLADLLGLAVVRQPKDTQAGG